MIKTKSRVRPRFLLIYYGLTLGWLWVTWRFLLPQGKGDWVEQLSFLIFLILCLAWLLGAVYHTVEWRTYGDVGLQILGPVYPGGKLAAVVHVSKPVAGVRTLKATLRCKEVFKDEPTPEGVRPIVESLVWSLEADFPMVTRGRRSECKVELELPANALLTTGTNSFLGAGTLGIYWELAIHADVPGIDLMRSFLVRVGLAPAARGMPPSQQKTM